MSLRITVLSLLALFFAGLSLCPGLEARSLSEEEQVLWVGTGAFRDGFYEIAEKQFTHFLKDHASHPRVYDVCYLLGKTFYVQGKWREAKACFARIVNESKSFEEMDHALYWAADVETKLGNGEEARRVLVQLVRRYPKFEWIDASYYLLGLLEYHSNRLDGAESSFKRVTQASKNPTLIQNSFFWLGILSFRQSRYEAASDHFQRILGAPSSASPEALKVALFWLGEAQLRLGRFGEAKPHFRRFSEDFQKDPLMPEAYWRLGYCEYRLGDGRQALEIFQNFKNQFKDSPLIPYTHYLVSQVLLLEGDYPASQKEIGPVVAKLPVNALTGASFLTLFWDHVQLGDMEGANRAFLRLQKLDHLQEEKTFIQWLSAEMNFFEGRISDALPYYFNIVNSGFREKALFQIGKGYFFEAKFREAIPNLDILQLEFPNSRYADESIFLKGECLTKLGHVDQALESYRFLVRQDRRDRWNLFALTEMGTLLASRASTVQAEVALKKVGEFFPQHPLYYHAALQLGNLSFRKGKLIDAIGYYSLVPKGNVLELLGAAYFGMGESFYQEGKHEKAFLSFEKAIGCLREGSLWFALTHLEIGNLQKQLGNLAEAKRSYMVILDRSKDEEIKRVARELLNDLESR